MTLNDRQSAIIVQLESSMEEITKAAEKEGIAPDMYASQQSPIEEPKTQEEYIRATALWGVESDIRQGETASWEVEMPYIEKALEALPKEADISKTLEATTEADKELMAEIFHELYKQGGMSAQPHNSPEKDRHLEF